MVKNSTNINKTNNHLSSSLTENMIYNIGNPDPVFGSVKSVNGIPTLPFR